jgi:hypothetical protein
LDSLFRSAAISGRRGGILLASTASASAEWKTWGEKLYAEPEVSWFETPLIVDNKAGGTIVWPA